MKKLLTILVMVLICCFTTVFAWAEESSADPAPTSLEAQAFSWKGYEMRFPFKSLDMATFGLNMDGEIQSMEEARFVCQSGSLLLHW